MNTSLQDDVSPSQFVDKPTEYVGEELDDYEAEQRTTIQAAQRLMELEARAAEVRMNRRTWGTTRWYYDENGYKIGWVTITRGNFNSFQIFDEE